MSKRYVSAEPLTMVRVGSGEAVTMAYVFEGAPVPEGADPDDVKRLVDEGFLVEQEVADSGDEDGPPAKSASKGDWEAYARSQGASDEDLDGQTKDDLIETYGA